MPPVAWHTLKTDEALERLHSSAHGLTTEEAGKRLTIFFGSIW